MPDAHEVVFSDTRDEHRCRTCGWDEACQHCRDRGGPYDHRVPCSNHMEAAGQQGEVCTKCNGSIYGGHCPRCARNNAEPACLPYPTRNASGDEFICDRAQHPTVIPCSRCKPTVLVSESARIIDQRDQTIASLTVALKNAQADNERNLKAYAELADAIIALRAELAITKGALNAISEVRDELRESNIELHAAHEANCEAIEDAVARAERAEADAEHYKTMYDDAERACAPLRDKLAVVEAELTTTEVRRAAAYSDADRAEKLLALQQPVIDAAVKYDEADDIVRGDDEIGNLNKSMRLAELVETIIEYRAAVEDPDA